MGNKRDWNIPDNVSYETGSHRNNRNMDVFWIFQKEKYIIMCQIQNKTVKSLK